MSDMNGADGWNVFPSVADTYDSGYDTDSRSDDISSNSECDYTNRVQTDECSETVCELVNDIHPIFASYKFPGADYHKLLPSLRLASRLIDTDCLLDFWHALFFGKERQVPNSDGSSHPAYFRTKTLLSARDRAMTRAQLRSMAHLVRFHRDSKLGPSSGCTCRHGGLLASCSPYEAGDFWGTHSQVSYSQELYQCVLDAHEQSLDTQLTTFADFAILLVHELAHAAYYATIPTHYSEVAFEYNTMSETGYDWTAFVFSGIPWWQGSSFVLLDWPSATIGVMYEKNEFNICLHGDYSKIEVRWPIPLDYLHMLFTDNFWENVVPLEGAAALKVPKEHGLRYKATDYGRSELFKPMHSDDTGLPEDCLLKQNGRIYLIAPGFDWEGFGRLMKINVSAIFGKDAGSDCDRLEIQHPEQSSGDGYIDW